MAMKYKVTDATDTDEPDQFFDNYDEAVSCAEMMHDQSTVANPTIEIWNVERGLRIAYTTMHGLLEVFR